MITDLILHFKDLLHVYVDGSGTIYDATLNQTDIVANNNKFYYCQVSFLCSVQLVKSLT